MSEQLRKKIVVVVFIGAVVWGGFNLFPSEKAAVPAPQPLATIAPLQSNPDNIMKSENLVNSSINVRRDSQKNWGRDPFIDLSKPKARAVVHNRKQHKLWKLSGIIYNNQSPSAIINQRSVSVGDVIDDATIKEINKKNVKIDLNGKEITLFVTKDK